MTLAQKLRARLQQREIVVAPGVYDAFSAYRAEVAGFEAVFVSDTALAATHLARPDIGLLTASETADIVARIGDRVNIPMLFTPILSPQEYQKLGVKFVIYPAGVPPTAAQAAQNFYANLKAGDANGDGKGHFDFGEMSRLLGIDDVVALQKWHGSV